MPLRYCLPWELKNTRIYERFFKKSLRSPLCGVGWHKMEKDVFGLAGYSQVNMLGSWYKFVNFGAKPTGAVLGP